MGKSQPSWDLEHWLESQKDVGPGPSLAVPHTVPSLWRHILTCETEVQARLGPSPAHPHRGPPLNSQNPPPPGIVLRDLAERRVTGPR